MVRDHEQEHANYRSRLFHRGLFESSPSRHSKSYTVNDDNNRSKQLSSDQSALGFRSPGSRFVNEEGLSNQMGSSPARIERNRITRLSKEHRSSSDLQCKEKQLSDVEMMKERFAKLLLGEDMSGGGKGVSSALALSNAITNLAASVFGEQWRLEPMSPARKSRWRKEMSWLLSVTDHIVEFVPSEKSQDGTSMEIMVARQRNDLHANIPALRKLDAMLIECLDKFKDQSEFYYVSRDDPGLKPSKRNDDKWWLPTVKVPSQGLSEVSRKFLQHQKDCVNQVLKAAMAINAQVLSEMEVPENYIESLPKNGRASLGDAIYKSITVDFFDPDQFLSSMDLSTEHKILDLKNRIEASIVIWKRKMVMKDGKSTWGSAVSIEKRELFEERAETVLLILKHRFPGTPQSALDISKIQYNKDVGHSILESYSRILESLAFTVMSRIEDVLLADTASQPVTRNRISTKETPLSTPRKDSLQDDTGSSRTLSDFMGWSLDLSPPEPKKDPKHDHLKDDLVPPKIPSIVVKKPSYVENLGGLRSPTARH